MTAHCLVSQWTNKATFTLSCTWQHTALFHSELTKPHSPSAVHDSRGNTAPISQRTNTATFTLRAAERGRKRSGVQWPPTHSNILVSLSAFSTAGGSVSVKVKGPLKKDLKTLVKSCHKRISNTERNNVRHMNDINIFPMILYHRDWRVMHIHMIKSSVSIISFTDRPRSPLMELSPIVHKRHQTAGLWSWSFLP